MMPATKTSSLVGDDIDIDFDCILQVIIDQHRIVAGRHTRLLRM